MCKEFKISDENIKKLSVDEVKFIFEQAEKKLKETDQSGNIVGRTTTLFTLIVGLIIAIIAFLSKRISEGNEDEIFLTSLFAFVYFSFFAFKIKKIY